MDIEIENGGRVGSGVPKDPQWLGDSYRILLFPFLMDLPAGNLGKNHQKQIGNRIYQREIWEKKQIQGTCWPLPQWRRDTSEIPGSAGSAPALTSFRASSQARPGGWKPPWGCSVAICLLQVTRHGKHTKNYGTSPFLMGKSTWINYFYGFSIAMLVITRGYVFGLRTTRST